MQADLNVILKHHSGPAAQISALFDEIEISRTTIHEDLTDYNLTYVLDKLYEQSLAAAILHSSPPCYIPRNARPTRSSQSRSLPGPSNTT